MGSISWVSPTVESRTLKRDRDKALAIRKVSPPFKSVVTDGTKALQKSTSCTKADVSQTKPVANTMCEQKVNTTTTTELHKHIKWTNNENKVFHKNIKGTKNENKSVSQNRLCGQKRFEHWTKEVLENNTELTANRSPSITIETIGLV